MNYDAFLLLLTAISVLYDIFEEEGLDFSSPSLRILHHAETNCVLVFRVALVAEAAGVRPECRGRTAIVGILLLGLAVAGALAVH